MSNIASTASIFTEEAQASAPTSFPLRMRLNNLRISFSRGVHARLFEEVSFSTDYTPVNAHDIDIVLGDITIPSLYVRAENPKGLVVFPTGMKGEIKGYQEILQTLEDHDLSYLVVPLPFPEILEEQGFNDTYSIYFHLMEHLFGDPNSIGFQIAKEDNIPVIPMTHSTSGGTLANVLTSGDMSLNQFYLDNTLTARNLSPFSSAAGASPIEENSQPLFRLRLPFFTAASLIEISNPREIFFKHMKKHPNDIFGDNVVELYQRVRLRMRGVTHSLPRDLMPQYKTIGMLMDRHEGVVERMKLLEQEDPAALEAVKRQVIYLNSQDTCSCSIYTARWAASLGVEIVEVESAPNHWHNPLIDNATERKKLALDILAECDEWQLIQAAKHAAEYTTTPLTPRHTQNPKVGVIGTIADWLLGKRRVGALNSTPKPV